MALRALRPRDVSTGAAHGNRAEVVLLGGKIYSRPGEHPFEAIAVRHGRVFAVGSDAEITDLVDRRTVIIPLGGRAALPGLIDAHTHFQKGALQRRYFIDWLSERASTLSDVLRVVRDRVSLLPRGEWLRGEALNEHHLQERRLPSRDELDSVATDNPVAIFGIGNHTVVGNSRALQLAGIDDQTPVPDGGRIERDSSGRLTGVLFERGKLRLDPNRQDSVLPRYSADQRSEALRRALPYMHSVGITSLHDMIVDPMELAAYSELRLQGDLSIRVQYHVRVIESRITLKQLVASGQRSGAGDDWLRMGAVKVSIDGICAWGNAALYEPYPGQPGNYGLIRVPADELEATIVEASRHGFRAAVHAVGPRAVDMALDAIGHARSSQGSALRHRIEHAYLALSKAQMNRLKELDVVVCTQPGFLGELGDAWHAIWGGEWVEQTMQLRSLLSAGVTVAGSSDFPCIPPDPFLGIAAATTRRTRARRTLGHAESVSASDAVRLWTTAAAHAGAEEADKGELLPGRLADVVVLNGDPFALPSDELRHVQPVVTIVGGKVVFARDEFDGLASLFETGGFGLDDGDGLNLHQIAGLS